MVGETDPELLGVFRGRRRRSAGRPRPGCGARSSTAIDSRVAVGGRLLDLRTPGAHYPEVFLPLHGAHQGDNAACAVAAAEAFFGAPLAAEVVEHALGSVTRARGGWRSSGRSPLVVLDGAHNVAGAQRAGPGARRASSPPTDDTVVVIGMLQGRDPSAMLEALRPAGVRTVVACTAPSPRAMPADVDRRGGARPRARRRWPPTPSADALSLARARLAPSGTLVVTGSLYVVAEAPGGPRCSGSTDDGADPE